MGYIQYKDNPNSEKPDPIFSDAEKEASFLDLAHCLLLYDTIMLKAGTGFFTPSLFDEHGSIPESFSAFLDLLRSAFGEDAITYGQLPLSRHMPNQAVCNLVSRLPNKEQLLTIQIPPGYRYTGQSPREDFDDRFTDPDVVRSVFTKANLDTKYAPVCAFLTNGMCYAAYAKAEAANSERVVTYVAAGGRMSALSLVLSNKDIGTINYPRQAYADLLDGLKLPSTGYDFSPFDSFFPSEVSNVTAYLTSLSSDKVISALLDIRKSPEMNKIRADWAERLVASSTALWGRQFTQSIENSTINGPVNMIIQASNH